MGASTEIRLTKAAAKQLNRVPTYIREAFQYWVAAIHLTGIRKVRMNPGYHDEPLKGMRFGQRSVRLSRSYRVVYKEIVSGVEILIIEVNKHEY